MSTTEHPRTGLRVLLDRIEAAAPVDAVAVAEHALATMLGARAVRVLLVEYGGRAIVRFDRSDWEAQKSRQRGIEHVETIELSGTVYERVLGTQVGELSASGTGTQVTVPVTVRGDAIGIIEFSLTGSPDAQLLDDATAMGRALGYVIVACRRYTDLFEWGQRCTPFSLAAEIQRRLLPSALAWQAGRLSLAGWLEPAATVAGDTFDYSLDRHTLHISISDAVGHDVHAALLATVFVSSLRNARRRGATLLEQARTANDALAAHSALGEFVTGQLIRIDLESGAATVINAGHPLPLRLRGGCVDELDLDIDIPFGLYPGREFRLQHFQLEPDDRVLFVTDGVLDRNSDQVAAPEVLRRTAHRPPRDVVRQLGDAVLHAMQGNLADDCTMLCLDWYPACG
ncbi:MAG TPA: PP2C family protein-serine/threonine phosphatase [Pseudonocardia sp.]|jgi:hypothetical protein|uniref:PP2C family protein-serine/threonine phosphatase n=1 Tax=Pseudonocardia sp. TaxID=60912 RepID=UPI002F419CDA